MLKRDEARDAERNGIRIHPLFDVITHLRGAFFFPDMDPGPHTRSILFSANNTLILLGESTASTYPSPNCGWLI